MSQNYFWSVMNKDFKKEIYKRKKQSKNKFKESFLYSDGTVKVKYRYGIWAKEDDCIEYAKLKEKTDYFLSLFESGDVSYVENSIENYYSDLCFITLTYGNNRKCRLSVLKSEILNFTFIPDDEKLLLECGAYESINKPGKAVWWT